MPPDDIPSNGAESLRPQPSKQGEIGYIEAVEPPTDILHTLNLYDLPTSHSFDRNSSPISPDALIFPPAQSEAITYPSSDQSSTASITKPNEMLDFFKPQGHPALGGLRLCTLAIFAVQLTLLGGTITAWVFASKLLALTAEKIIKLHSDTHQLSLCISFLSSLSLYRLYFWNAFSLVYATNDIVMFTMERYLSKEAHHGPV